MPSFADPLIKIVAACCLVLAPLSALAGNWPYSSRSGGMNNQGLRSTAAFINAHPGYKRACRQMAFEHSDITKKHCDAVEDKAENKLFSLLNNNKVEKQTIGAYWTACIKTNTLGDNAINYPVTVKCVKFAAAKCTPRRNSSNYSECMSAIYDRAYEKQ